MTCAEERVSLPTVSPSRSPAWRQLLQMLQFEWRWQLSRPFPWAITGVLLVMALLMIRQGYGPEAVNINSPYSVAQSWGLLSLWFLATQTIFTVHGGLRDDEHRTHELIGSRPIQPWQLVTTRVLGIVGSGVIVAAVVLLVQMLAPFVIATDPTRVGPLRVLPYLWVLLTLVLPNVLFVSAVLYAVAMRTRKTMATYIGAIAVFALYMVIAVLVDSPLMANATPPSPETLARAAMLDPFGISAFFEATRYWTPAERNELLVPLTGRLLWNRLLWSGMAGGLLMLAYRHSSARRHRVSATRRWFGRREPAAINTDPRADHDAPGRASIHASVYQPVEPASQGMQQLLHATYQRARLECRLLFGSWMVQALVVLFAVTVGIEALSELRSGEYGTRMVATSAILMRTLAQPLELIATLSAVYFAADVAWRERLLSADGVIDATPVSNLALYLGKLAALCVIPWVFAVAGLAVMLAMQLLSGAEPIRTTAYLGVAWFVAVPVMLRAVVMLGLHLVSPNRWIGLVAGVAFMIITFGGGLPGLQHAMLRYSVLPSPVFSDLDGFGVAAESFGAMAVYWGSWALLLAVCTWRLWRRGLERGVAARVRVVVRRITKRGDGTPSVHGNLDARLAPAFAMLAIAASGGWLYEQGGPHSDWMSDTSRTEWRVAYERTYRHVQRRAQPNIVDVQMAVDLMPARRAASLEATFVLENRSDAPIDTVWVAPPRDLDNVVVQLRNAELVRIDSAYATWMFAMETPLLPGASEVMTYRGTLDRGGVRFDEFQQDIAENGSYLTSSALMPIIGYRPSYEVQDSQARAEAGLGAPTAELVRDTTARVDSLTRLARRGGGAAWFTLNLSVSTDSAQRVVGPGRLAQEWTADGRRHVSYVSDGLMTPVFAIASARYAVQRATEDGVTIEVWHHPDHERNAAQMLRAAQRTLDVLGTTLGAYPRPVLRMAEVPLFWRFGAYATTGALFFTEDRGMLTDLRAGDVDLVSRRVAHEVAHQWWGHAVMPLSVPGSRVVVESLAKYSEQRVIASLHGEDAVAPILAYDHDRYLSGRAREARTEPPLVAMTDEAHLDYGKGALALAALHARLGDSAMTEVLRSLVRDEGGSRGAATAAMLHERLRAAAPTPELRALVNEWMLERVLYDMRIGSATAAPTATGYQLELVAHVDRLVHHKTSEQASPADGTLVDVLVRGEDARVLSRGAVRVERGVLRWSGAVAERPVQVEIDPDVRWIDRERSNNVRAVRIGARP